MAGRGVLGKINGQRATHKRLTTCGANNEGNRKNTAIVTCCAGPHCFDNFRHWWMVWVCGRHRNDRRLCRVCMRVRAVYFFRRPVASTTTTKLHNISNTDDVWPATSPKGISGERKWRKNKRLNQCGSNVSNRAIMAIVVIDRLPPSLTLMPYIFDQHRGGYTMSMTKRQYEREKKIGGIQSYYLWPHFIEKGSQLPLLVSIVACLCLDTNPCRIKWISKEAFCQHPHRNLIWFLLLVLWRHARV